MKCPKCGSKNSDTNRFCRSCGCRLESIAETEPQVAPDAAVVDEVALGEELFEVWQLYSAGDIDAALERIEEVSKTFPDRSSVHSLYALIYERQAEIQIEAGDVEAARALLLNALDRYEKIVGMNPDSAADRDKLAALRKKLGAYKPKAKLDIAGKLVPAIKRIPVPALVGAGAFLLVLMVAGFVLAPHQQEKPRNTVRVSQLKPATEPVVTQPVQIETRTNSAPIVMMPSRVYTFPTPPPPAPPKPAAASTTRTVSPSQLPPLKVPAMDEIKIKPVKDKTEAPKVAPPKPKPASEEPEAEPDNSDKTKKPDGATTLAKAIKLQEQGNTEQAIITAKQAMVLFYEEATAGKTSSSRGAENARKMIDLWQSSEPKKSETEE